jgi:hypothetical protein
VIGVNDMQKARNTLEHSSNNQARNNKAYLRFAKRRLIGNSLFPYLKNLYWRIDDSFRNLNTSEKSKPLEQIGKDMAKSYKEKQGFEFSDLTNKFNAKENHENHFPDIVIKDKAVIELKNWNCHTERGYIISLHNAIEEILSRFKFYMDYELKILVIGDAVWGENAKEYLEAKGITIIELGYQVTNDKKLVNKAYAYVKSKIDKLLGCGNLDTTSNTSIIKSLSSLVSVHKIIFTRISCCISNFDSIIRLKNWLFKAKTSLKSRLSISIFNLKGRTSLSFNALMEKLSDAKVLTMSGVTALQRYSQRFIHS